MKQCSRCKEIKPDTDFTRRLNRQSGLKSWCKRCEADQARIRVQRPEQRERIAIYQKSEARKKVLERYNKSDKRRAVSSRYYRNHGREYNKTMARRAVTYAIRRQEMSPIKTQVCNTCGNQAAHYHHHKGYDPEYWLDVIPLCVRCHTDVHL